MASNIHETNREMGYEADGETTETDDVKEELTHGNGQYRRRNRNKRFTRTRRRNARPSVEDVVHRFEMGTVCPLCLNREVDYLHVLPCGHLFHNICITDCMRWSDSCPTCILLSGINPSNRLRNSGKITKNKNRRRVRAPRRIHYSVLDEEVKAESNIQQPDNKDSDECDTVIVDGEFIFVSADISIFEEDNFRE